MGPTDLAATLRFETVGLRIAGGRELLVDLDLALAPGAITIVGGARDAGKTLIADLATLARNPDRGRVCIKGHDAARLAPAAAARLRRRIGVCAQRPTLLPELDAADNAAIPLRLGGVAAAEARSNAAELIGWLGGPDIAARRPARLSHRDARCVALARALVHRPALAVLDEPLRATDDVLAERLATLVNRMRHGGTSFLILTDDDHWAGLLEAPARLRLAGGRLTGGRLEGTADIAPQRPRLALA